MGKVILRGHIQVPPGDLEAVEAELGIHIQLTRAEAGCLVFEIVQDIEDRCRFTVYEEFSDRAFFDHHQSRTQRSKWGEVAANVERHYEILEQGDEQSAVRRTDTAER